MKSFRLLLILCVAAALSGCASSLLAAGPEAEAEKAARDYWAARITRCGADHYSIQVSRACAACDKRETLVQFKDPAVTTRTEKVNEAARLNGIEMKGSSSVDAAAFRVHFNGRWEDWRKSTGFGNKTPFVAMTLRGGRWQFDEPGERSTDQGWKPVACEKLPK